MADTFIDDVFQAYRDRVIPKNAHANQVTDIQLAFYEGANTVMHLLTRISKDDVSEDVGVAMLESLQREVQGFRLEKMVAGGKA